MVQALLARVPRLRLAVSATTRARRPGEQDGVHYWFLTDEEFDRRLAEGDFLEYHVFPWGQRSGTLLSELDRIAAAGDVPLLELELNGSLAVKEQDPRRDDDLRRRAARGARAPAARAGDRERRRDRGADRARRRAARSSPARSTSSSRTTTASGPRTSASSIVERELAACR